MGSVTHSGNDNHTDGTQFCLMHDGHGGPLVVRACANRAFCAATLLPGR
jgi:hypothetical protein